MSATKSQIKEHNAQFKKHTNVQKIISKPHFTLQNINDKEKILERRQM